MGRVVLIGIVLFVLVGGAMAYVVLKAKRNFSSAASPREENKNGPEPYNVLPSGNERAEKATYTTETVHTSIVQIMRTGYYGACVRDGNVAYVFDGQALVSIYQPDIDIMVNYFILPTEETYAWVTGSQYGISYPSAYTNEEIGPDDHIPWWGSQGEFTCSNAPFTLPEGLLESIENLTIEPYKPGMKFIY